MSLRQEVLSIFLRASAAAVIAYFSMRYMVRFLDPNYAITQESKKKVTELMRRLKLDFDVQLTEHELRIATQLVPSEEGVEWSEIGGYQDVIQELDERVITPLCAKARGRLPPSNLFSPSKGVLLYGPPGCGKTLLARAVARAAEARFIHLDLSTLTDKWYGESQKLASAVFSLAAKMQPCIIFIDEIDAFLRERQSSDNEATAMIKSVFMSMWDGFASGDDTVIVMGATNRPFDVDAAILRRMPVRFHIQLPDEAARISILRTIMKNENINGEIDYSKVAKHTKNMSGSDLKEICRLAALGRLKDANLWSDPLSMAIGEEDLLNSAAVYSRTAIPQLFQSLTVEDLD